MADDERASRSFLQSTTGLLTAVAGFLTAVAALIGALIGIGVIGGGEGAGSATTTTARSPIATCEAATLIDIAERSVKRDVSGITLAGGTVEACRKGYALVRIEPDQSLCAQGAGACFDPVNVFFKIIRDEWEIVDLGSGISCDEQDLIFALAEACRELGLGPHGQ